MCCGIQVMAVARQEGYVQHGVIYRYSLGWGKKRGSRVELREDACHAPNEVTRSGLAIEILAPLRNETQTQISNGKMMY
jgi:hypothetical protein